MKFVRKRLVRMSLVYLKILQLMKLGFLVEIQNIFVMGIIKSFLMGIIKSFVIYSPVLF